MTEIMLFHTADRVFGVELAHVREVHRANMVPLHDPSENSPESRMLAGFPDGKSAPLHDLCGILAETACTLPGKHGKILRIDAGNRELALRVEDTGRVIEAEPERILPLPDVFGEKTNAWFPRVLVREETLILLLNPSGMIAFPDAGFSGPADTATAEPDDIIALTDILEEMDSE